MLIVLSIILAVLFISTYIIFRKNVELRKSLLFDKAISSGKNTKLNQFVESIAQGNYDVDLFKEEERDALVSALYDMKIKLKINQEQDYQRNWVSTGVAEISDIIRADNSNSDVYFLSIISFVVKYTQSNQGGLFLFNEPDKEGEEPFLELVAAFAYSKKKYVEKKVLIGEGLVGQCYLDKELIYITDVPQNYTHITSGLGEATASCLVLLPLIVNDEFFGVIEIASFTEMQPYKIEFLKRISENIASGLLNIKIAKKNLKHIEESNKLAEQMRKQEEKLKRNMSIMQSTQERVNKLVTEMNVQTNLINSIAMVFKTDLDRNITYVNSEFLKVTKYSKEEIIGKNIRILNSGEHDDAFFEKLNKTINGGSNYRFEIKNKAKDGTFFWCDMIIAPVIDEEGKIKEFLSQCFSIDTKKQLEREIIELRKGVSVA